jgi:peptidoglycan/LPS O-acetylase OafA/YrhL
MSRIVAAHKDTAYYHQLDGLRALAVFAVVAEHMTPIQHWFRRMPCGVFGVQLFFVLSGFLITGILLRCRPDADPRNTVGHSLWAFYGRRFLRIFPLYYLTLTILYLCNFPHLRETILWHVCYLSNVYYGLHDNWLGHLSHFWTLGVEEQFYLCWPLLILFLPRQALLPVTLSMVAVAPLYRAAMATFAPSWYLASVWVPFASLDSLTMGALLALCGQPGWADFRQRSMRWMFWVGGPLLAAVMCLQVAGIGRFGRLDTVVLRFAMALFCFWLVGRTADGLPGAMGRVLTFAPIVYLGKISYGIYVIHNFVPDLLTWLATQTGLPLAVEPGLLAIPVCLAVSTALASFSWYAFEAPLNALKVYFPYRSARPQAMPTPTLVVPEPTSEAYVTARS